MGSWNNGRIYRGIPKVIHSVTNATGAIQPVTGYIHSK